MPEKPVTTALEKVLAIAEDVCWFDWSGNDQDAVHAIDQLRLALADLWRASEVTNGETRGR
jgi:hypothetical protein